MGEGRHSLRSGEMKKFPLLVPSLKAWDTRKNHVQEAVAQLCANRVVAADREAVINEVDTAIAEMYQIPMCDLVRPRHLSLEAQDERKHFAENS